MANISFEPMKDEYIPAVTDIYNYYVLNSTATFHIGELSCEEVREIVYTGDARFSSYVILDGDLVCGYCLLAHYKKREAYDSTAEVTIYLKPGYTRKGVGTQALRFLEQTAQRNDFHALLSVICGENEESIGLFIKMGYEKCAHYKEVGRKYGRLLDVVCYQKILTNKQA